MNRTGAQFNRVSGRIEKGSAVTAKVFTLGNSFELSGRDYYEKSILNEITKIILETYEQLEHMANYIRLYH